MVRILGNSPERIRIHDLGDVIYYKQRKQYTDEEFESSKDLQKALKKGIVTKLDSFSMPRGSDEDSNSDIIMKTQASAVNLEDIKRAVRDALPESTTSIAETFKQALPELLTAVRNEISSIISNIPASRISNPELHKGFRGPEYVPDINTSNMISSIKPEERSVEEKESISDSLAALRKIKSNK